MNKELTKAKEQKPKCYPFLFRGKPDIIGLPVRLVVLPYWLPCLIFAVSGGAFLFHRRYSFNVGFNGVFACPCGDLVNNKGRTSDEKRVFRVSFKGIAAPFKIKVNFDLWVGQFMQGFNSHSNFPFWPVACRCVSRLCNTVKRRVRCSVYTYYYIRLHVNVNSEIEIRRNFFFQLCFHSCALLPPVGFSEGLRLWPMIYSRLELAPPLWAFCASLWALSDLVGGWRLSGAVLICRGRGRGIWEGRRRRGEVEKYRKI